MIINTNSDIEKYNVLRTDTDVLNELFKIFTEDLFVCHVTKI